MVHRKIDYFSIGERLKNFRSKLGLSQIQFTKELPLSGCYLSQCERGLKHISISKIADIAFLYDISIDWIIYGSSSEIYDSLHKTVVS